MKASDYVAAFLAKNGVTAVYEVCGGMITHLLDSLLKQPEIRIVSMHHEQAAAFAAEGGARLTGVPGIALATSGPGATNLITGIGSCFFDSVPAVFITGQVNTHELRGESGVRQAGFQETDIVAIVGPITKAAWRVPSAAELPHTLAAAFCLALEGRPGPVLVDIPMDVQREEVDISPEAVEPAPHPVPEGLDAVIEELLRAERPLIIAGGGVRAAAATQALREFAERTGLPVASSLLGLDVLPFDHPLRVGLIGTYGNRWANLAMRDSDCLLILGARLDVRQTGADTAAFRLGKTLIQVDIDPRQLAWRVPVDLPVQANLAVFLRLAIAQASRRPWPDGSTWRMTIDNHRQAWPDIEELIDIAGINPAVVMHQLSALAGRASAFAADVGQNQMWAAQSLRLSEGQRFLTSGGMGAMGFALPASIGAAVAMPGAPVVTIVGDGGMQMNIQDLETVARLALPIKIVVFNNRCLGLVRQFQDEYFGSRYQSTLWGYGAPDFVAVAGAYGIKAQRVVEAADVCRALGWLMSDVMNPALLEVSLESNTRVRPKVSFGNPVYVMEPPPGTDT